MDQARGGGGCGPEDQSGGRTGSRALNTIATTAGRAAGVSIAEKTLKHLVRQSSAVQTPLVSQQGALFLPPE